MAVDSTTDRAVVLTEHDPVTVVDELPRCVFPVTATVELQRSIADDEPYEDLHPPEFPVEVREPESVPYVPETTVCFDNPAERAPDGERAWEPREFVASMNDVATQLGDSPTDPDDIRLTGLVVAELPPRYLTSVDGTPWAKQALFEEGGDITLGYLRKHGSLTAHEIREELGDGLPGETRAPLQLVQVSEVTAKQSLASRETVQAAGRTRYYTEPEAEKAGRPGDAPKHWKTERVQGPREEARSLDAVITDVDAFLPQFSEAEFVQSMTFDGRTVDRERFYAEDVLHQND